MCGREYLVYRCEHRARGKPIYCPAHYNITLEHVDTGYETKIAGDCGACRREKEANESKKKGGGPSRT